MNQPLFCIFSLNLASEPPMPVSHAYTPNSINSCNMPVLAIKSGYADADGHDEERTMRATMTESRVMTAKQVQEALGVSRATVDRLFAAGELASFKVRGARRVRREDLERFVESRMEQSKV